MNDPHLIAELARGVRDVVLPREQVRAIYQQEAREFERKLVLERLNRLLADRTESKDWWCELAVVYCQARKAGLTDIVDDIQREVLGE